MRLVISSLLIGSVLLAAFVWVLATAPVEAIQNEDTISGDWELVINNQGDTHKMSLNLKLDGQSVSGNFESSTPLGNGPVAGTWADNKIDPDLYKRFTGLTKFGVEAYLCEITFKRNKIDPAKAKQDSFLKFVPSGVATVAELQAKGFGYIKVG